MIDTIKTLNDTSLITHELSEHYRNILVNQGYNRSEYGETFSGTYQNIRVKVNGRGIYTEGSLPIFLKGNNQLTLTKKEVEVAIKKLGEELRLPLMEAKAKRIDLASNILTKFRVEELYNVCGENPRFKRLEQNSGLNYGQSKRYITLYNKIKEVKKEEKIIDVFKGKNVLRYEYRWLCDRTLAKDLNLSEVLMKDVITNYDILIKKWASAFLIIAKDHEMVIFNAEAFKDSTSFNTQMLIQGVQRIGGLQAVLRAIKVAKDRGDFGYNNKASNLRKKYTTLMSHPVLSEKSLVGKEVEDKVKRIAFAMSSDHVEGLFL